MTERELHKLGRESLLQFLVEYSKENAVLKGQLERAEAVQAELQESYSRLKEKLNDKDTQLERLKVKLDQKDATIGALQNELQTMCERVEAAVEAGAEIAETSLRLNRILRQSRGACSTGEDVLEYGILEKEQERHDTSGAGDLGGSAENSTPQA